MSLKTAMQKIVTVFNTDMSASVFGVIDNEGTPEDAIKGKFPATYLEQGTQSRKYESRLPVEPTEISTDIYMLHVFHKDGVTSGETMKDEAARREQLIVDMIQNNTALRTWESDGDKGFGISPVTTLWYILPHAPVAAFRLQLRIFAYGN